MYVTDFLGGGGCWHRVIGTGWAARHPQMQDKILYADRTEITSWWWTIICCKHVEDSLTGIS